MATPFLRFSIPDDSTFKAQIKNKDGTSLGAEAPVVATGFFRTPNGSQHPWSDAQLRAGVEEELEAPDGSPRTYSGLVQLNFAQAFEVVLEMEVERADNSMHIYREEIDGKANGVDRTVIALAMAL
jgi:hypothetical protein